ncbi:MAG: type II secretion system F family protein [Frankia sp.]
MPQRAGVLAGLTTGMTAAVALGGRGSALAGVLAGLAAGAVVGVAVAVLAGALVAWFPTWLPAVVVHRRAARRDARLVLRLPIGLDLVAASLEAGAPPARALAIVGEALGGPIGDELAIVANSLWLGASPAEACRRLLADHGAGASPPLRALARALGRADESGSRLATSLRAIANSQRADAHTRAIEHARRIGVYAVAPLGLCFLPAFILVGITPIVAGIVSQLTL